ncbi:RDD family protein [Salibacterium lacus]|uniref:RDD family protein n=1 Tax=Salibacterium lacus TaxID=1898109 RepID=A0ABW5T417_9BACI
MHVSNPAGIFHRIGAALIDIGIIFVVTRILAYVLYGDFFVSNSTFFTILVTLYWVMIPSIWRGRTIGKWTCGLTIASVYREGAGFGTMLLRYTGLSLIYLLTLGVGLIVSAVMIIWRDDRRALHDFAAGTYITYDAPERLEARTIFNNRRALAVFTVLLIAGGLALDRFEHTTYEDEASAMLEDINGPVDEIKVTRSSRIATDSSRYAVLSGDNILQTLKDAPEETVHLRRTGNTIYPQYDMEVGGRSLILGENGISLNGQAYTFIEKNPTREIIHRFQPEWEER